MEEVTIELLLRVRYSLKSESAESMEDLLYRMVENAIQRGLLTGDTDSEVEEYSTSAVRCGD